MAGYISQTSFFLLAYPFPNFEYLEAKGLERLAKLRREI
jgi:hypothetical protein